jgi:alpha-beta hydrolase superfamily lysophospholipase
MCVFPVTKFPNMKFYILGYCFGANVALSFALRKHENFPDKRIAGYLILSPYLEIPIKSNSFQNRLTIKTMRKIAYWFPSRVTLDFELDYHSSDPKFHQMVKNDPLVDYGPLTGSFIRWTLKEVEWMFNESEKRIEKLSLPRILFMHGMKDKISSHTATETFYSKCLHCNDRTIILFPNLKHQLLLDLDNEFVYQYLIQFLKEIPFHNLNISNNGNGGSSSSSNSGSSDVNNNINVIDSNNNNNGEGNENDYL